MSKHSPGPWSIGANDVLYTADGEDIGVLGFGSKVDDRLIAAAPEMLELVRYLANWTSDDNHYLGDMPAKARALLQRISD